MKTNKMKLLSAVVVSLLGGAVAFAGETTSASGSTVAEKTDVKTTKGRKIDLGNQVSELNNGIATNPAKTDKEDSRSAEEIITDRLDAYLASHPNKGETKYVSGIAQLSFDPTDSNYGDSLQLKYIEAVANAQASFITSINQEIKDQMVSKVVSNQGTESYNMDSEKPEEGTRAATQAKIDALNDVEVDQKLREKGLNPDDYQSPKEKRKLLGQATLTTETMTKAFGDLAGLIPVKTFFEQKNGKGAIGVVLMYSPKIRTLFEAIKRGETPMIVGKGGKSPRDLFVNKSGYDLFPEFGIRLGFDENNKPYILTYGQGTYTGPQIPGQSGANMAYQQASLMAKRNVAQAIAGTMNTSTTLRMAQEAAVDLVKNERNGKITQKTTNELSKQLRVNMETNAKANIKGLTQVKRWSYKVPGTANKIYGVVYQWTPELAEQAKAVINYDYDTAKKKYAPEKSVTSHNSEDNTSSRVSRQSQDNPYENQW